MRKSVVLFSMLIALAACTHRQPVVEQSLSDGWTLTGDTLDINLSVNVPSVVQQNLYDAGIMSEDQARQMLHTAIRHAFLPESEKLELERKCMVMHK